MRSPEESVLFIKGANETTENESIWLGILDTSVLWNILVNKGATAKD